ncbi:MAG TPA: serine hydrolase [Spirochaetota bacterium]|nr:serine hydrolase [Spirochaetota bacterium]HPG50187.1 serine hydrolase [Spirochaetota bacterium]HPN13094.1 serine hydrolase [Spirochaetota bacterium]
MRNSPLTSAIVLCSLLSAAAAGGCFVEKSAPQQNKAAVPGPGPGTLSKEAARELRARNIIAEKKSLSAWLLANTYYPIVPSAAAAVVEHDRVIYRQTVRCEPSRPFGVASLTKTFTAIAILQLAERGIISLNDPVSKYLQVTFENRALGSRPITIWHLLTHTSGLVEDPNPKYEEKSFPFTVPEQKYPTGFRFNYCNQGYNLLGFVVFEASGMPLGEYITRKILIPMEMYDSRAPLSTHGAAGVECSIDDLANYLVMLMHGGVFRGKRIISKRMYRTIVDKTIEGPSSKNEEYRGICFRVWAIDGDVYSLHHAAHMPGAGGFMQMFPRHDCGYVFISNPPVYDREEFYGYYYGLKSRLARFCRALMTDDFDPVSFQADRPSPKQLAMFTGRYRMNDGGAYVEIELHPGGYLVATKSTTGLRYGLIPTSLHTFVYIYPGQSEKGEIYDFVMKGRRVAGLGVKDGYFIRE